MVRNDPVKLGEWAGRQADFAALAHSPQNTG